MPSFYSGYSLPATYAFDRFKQLDYFVQFVQGVVDANGRSNLPAVQPDTEVIGRWPVRDQGNKPTCVAFAASAAIEYALGRRGQKPTWHSTHFFYYNMRLSHSNIADRPQDYDKGSTLLEQAKSVMESDGVCDETAAPYGTSGICEISDHGNYLIAGKRPPEAAYQTAVRHTTPKLGLAVQHKRFPEGAPFGNNFAATFHRVLANKASIAIGIPIFPTIELGSSSNLDTMEAVTVGVIRGPGEPGSKVLPGTAPIAGHAICLVGFYPDNSYPELNGGWFIFRNSVGTSFAKFAFDGRFGVPRPGYGAISAAYVAAACHEYLIIQ